MNLNSEKTQNLIKWKTVNKINKMGNRRIYIF